MENLVLYAIEPSPPCRAVLLTLNALGLIFEFRPVNLQNGEHLTEEFMKKNPQHTVPVLEDNGEYIWDSHAIAAYLVRKYSKTGALYPKGFHQRAVVDQRLHFDSGVLFPTLTSITVPLFTKNATQIPQEKIDAIYNAFNFLETFLENDYIAGNTLTIADFSIVSTVASFKSLAPMDANKTPKLIAWIDRLAKLPYYEMANGKGATIFNEMVKQKLAS